MSNPIMSDAEHLELERLNDNEILLSALKKIFLAGIYRNGTLKKDEDPDYTRNFAFGLSYDKSGQEFNRSNEDLGAILRANNEALRLLFVSFGEIEKFKKIIKIDTKPVAKHR